MALRAPVCGMLQLRPYDTLEIQQQLSMVPCRHQGAAVEQEPTAHCRGFHQEHQEEEEEEEEEEVAQVLFPRALTQLDLHKCTSVPRQLAAQKTQQ